MLAQAASEAEPQASQQAMLENKREDYIID